MDDQQILDNAPEGATHVDAEKDYFKFAWQSWMFYDDQDDDWFMTDSKSLRSLADIKELVELSKVTADLHQKLIDQKHDHKLEMKDFKWFGE